MPELSTPFVLDGLRLTPSGSGSPILDQYTPRAVWRFLTGPRTGGYDQELTAAKSRKLTVRLTSASEAGFTIDGRHPQAGLIDELSTDVHVHWQSKQGVNHQLFRGRANVPSDDGDEDSHTTTVSALSYKAVLDRQHLLDGVALNNNPGFQHGLTSWTGAGGTLEVDAEAQTAGKSGRITPTGSDATVTIASDDIAVTAGTAYRATPWLRCAVTRSVTVRIEWKTSGHAFISSSSTSLALTGEEWARTELDAVAPATAAFASIVAEMTGTPPATDVLWLDDGRLTTQPYHSSKLRFEQVDQAQIAWELIDDTQSRTGGDLGISPGWTGSTPTGKLRDRLFEIGDNIGERIQQLSELIDGFDWDIQPISASALSFDVWSPERGSNRGVVAEPGGLITKWKRSVSPSTYANAIRMTGADGLDAQEREAEDLGSQAAGRWTDVIGDSGLTTQATLNERVHWQMKQSQVITPTWQVTLAPGVWEGPGHIWLGDPIRLVVYSGRLAVDTTLRVFEMTFDISDDGTETIELSLGGPKPDYRRMPTLFERRLTNLERR